MADTNDAAIGYSSASGSGANFPKYREWTAATGTWTSEVELATTSSTVKTGWIEFSPISNKRVMIVLANDGNIDSYVCIAACTTAANWNVTLGIADLWTADPADTSRPFDLAFETTSGDLILVYDKVSTTSQQELFYRVMSKGAVVFGSESPIDTPAANAASDYFYPFIRLDSRKTTSSDEIAMIMQDDTNLDTHVMIWSGSAWGESETISTDYAPSSLRRELIGIAYETNSGDAMAVSGNTTNVLYQAHAAGGAWNGTGHAAGTWAVGNLNWLSVKGNPLSSSNEIFVAGLGADSDLDSMYWSGTAWTDHSEHDASVTVASQRDVDFAWDGGTSSGILVWHTATNTMEFKRFNATNSFSTLGSYVYTAGGGRWVVLATNPTTADATSVLGLAIDANVDASGIKWSGGNTNATATGSADITVDGRTGQESLGIAFQRSTASEVVTISVAINMAASQDTPETASVAYTITCTGGGGTHDGNAATQTFLCNPNTTVTVATPTDTASSRFRFSDASTSKQFTSCTAGACSTTTYSSNYRQFNQTITLTGLDAQTILVTRTQVGTPGTQAVGTSTATAWADQASTVSFEDPKVVTTNQERYDTGSTTSFTNVQVAATRSATYFHQYAILTTLSGLDAAQTNPITRTQLGVSSTDNVPGATATVVWNDVSATYTAPTTVTISGTERFISYNTTGQRSFAVSAYAAKTYIYNHEYQLASLTFKTSGGNSLTTAPTAFVFTTSNSTVFTSISSTWVKNGTATVTGITWRGLTVTPTANTIPITSGGAKTLNTNIAENSSPLIQFAIDTGTIASVTWDSTLRKLSYTGTATGTKDTIVEYPTSSLSHAQLITVDGIAHSDNSDDTVNGVLIIDDVAFSAHNFIITFGGVSGGGGGGGGSGVGGGGGGSPIPPITLGPFAAGLIIPHLQAEPGTTQNYVITINVTGTQRVTIKEIAFSSHEEWFTVGLDLPYTEVTQQFPDPRISVDVPLTVTVPASYGAVATGILPAAYADENIVMVTTVSNGIDDITINKPLVIDTDPKTLNFNMFAQIPTEFLLVGVVALVIGGVVIAKRKKL